MQIARQAVAIATGAALALPAHASAQARAPSDEAAAPAEQLDLRVSLSSFLYRETGDDAPPIIDQGAALQNASPVRRYFGDLRLELVADHLELDARVRQTGARRYQSGVNGAGEYELRTLAYRLGSKQTWLTLGRQRIDWVGATKVDGLAVTRKLGARVGVTAFGGAFPALGSRSVDTDYPRLRTRDGSEGARLLPVTGGLGGAYQTPNYHAELGVAAVYVPQDVPDATSQDASRVYVTSSGYGRPLDSLDLYHYALVDVAGADRGGLTNGSLGLDLRPLPALRLSAAVHHLSSDLLQISARNVLEDPDPSAIGVVQNNLAVTRVSQDLARGGISLALARQRFEISMSAALHRRPAIDVALADGSGAVTFPEARSAETTFTVLDRRSLAGVRASLSAGLTFPIGDASPNRARATVVRVALSRAFADGDAQLELDGMGQRWRDAGGTDLCMSSLDALACYGTSRTTAAQLGVTASWRVSREWLLLADTHLGYQDQRSEFSTGPVAWPTVYSLTSYLRLQWRYR